MNTISMQHDDTGELIDVQLGKTPWVARKIIQDQGIIGYYATDIEKVRSLLQIMEEEVE